MAATFTDSFDRANSSTVGNGWVEASGDFSISSNTLTSTLVDGSIMTQDTTLPADADYYVEARVKSVFGGSIDGWSGLLARYTDSTHFYLLQWGRGGSGTQNGLELYVNNAGFTELGKDYTVSIADDTWYTIKLVIVGSRIRCYLNNKLVIGATNSALTSAGKIGVRKGGTGDTNFWDDLSFGPASTTLINRNVYTIQGFS